MKTINDLIALAKDNQLFKLPANLQETTPLTDQGLDSLDMIMLLHEVETSFNVRIPQEQTNQLRSLHDIVNFLNTNA